MFGVAVHGEMLKGNFGRATGGIAFHGVAGSACLDPRHVIGSVRRF
jgi:hypothetical protein